VTRPSGAGSLSAAIGAGLAGVGVPGLVAAVQRLMASYRSGELPEVPVMASPSDAGAYAAYRMPATAAATALAVREMCQSLDGWTPKAVVDIGAGTGGAAWAVADELPDIETMILLEQSADAIRLGKAIMANSASAVLRCAIWRSWRLAGDDEPLATVPSADLVTVAYVLGELTPDQQASLVTLA
jgi:ribosomal protein RSM22 (predicted rRNA methylase)